jgi:hypothetical protein
VLRHELSAISQRPSLIQANITQLLEVTEENNDNRLGLRFWWLLSAPKISRPDRIRTLHLDKVSQSTLLYQPTIRRYIIRNTDSIVQQIGASFVWRRLADDDSRSSCTSTWSSDNNVHPFSRKHPAWGLGYSVINPGRLSEYVGRRDVPNIS